MQHPSHKHDITNSTSGWQWQSDALWQSCSETARKQADQWNRDQQKHYAAMRQLSRQQPLTSLANDADGLQQCSEQAAQLRAVSTTLVVVGTGGASLGARALCALSANASRVKFLENCDPVTMEKFLKLPKDKTSWCIVSKSGETVETLVSALMLLGHYAGSQVLLRERVRVITANPDSTLARLAAEQKWPVLNHPAELSGRYSVFSIVGLLPAAYIEMDIVAMAKSADAAMQQLLLQIDDELWNHAIWIAANAMEKPIHLLMAYADRLRPTTQWFKQLWAESLAKDGKGQTPVTSIGAIDQHSQLQLYLDGPRDKLVTLWLPKSDLPALQLPNIDLRGAEFLRGKSIGDVMHATSEATVATLRNASVPLRVLRGVLTPESLSMWMARQMLETLLVAHLLGVDPYSQPAVEGGKQLTRAALAQGS